MTEEELIEHVQPLLVSCRDTRQEAIRRATQATAARQAREVLPQMPITPPHDAVRPLRVRKVQPTSVPSQALQQREAQRVEDTRSFSLKAVPVSARRRAVSKSSTGDMPASQSVPITLLVDSEPFIAPPPLTTSSSSGASSSSIATVSSSEGSAGVAVVTQGSFDGLMMRKRHSDYVHASPFNNEAFAPAVKGDFPLSASLPSLSKAGGTLLSKLLGGKAASPPRKVRKEQV